ncbi:Scn11a, partial [Symbiodinium sp. KB8]
MAMRDSPGGVVWPSSPGSAGMDAFLSLISDEHSALLQMAAGHQQAWGLRLDATFNKLASLSRELSAVSTPSVPSVRMAVPLGETDFSQPKEVLSRDSIPRVIFDRKPGVCDPDSCESTGSKENPDSWVEAGDESANSSSNSSDMSGDSIFSPSPGRDMGRQTTPFSHASMKEYDKKIGSKQQKADQLVIAHSVTQEPKGMSCPSFRATLDYFAGAVVLLNSFVMLVEFELEGRELGPTFGLEGYQITHETRMVFSVIDALFVFVFVVEWSIRLWFDRWRFVRDAANLLDTILVFSGVVDLMLSWALEGSGASRSIVVLRLMRAVKSLRAVRMVRSLRFFQGLRVLVKACQCFLPSLCWSMVLLLVFMSMGALMMGNLLQDFVVSEAMDFEDRKWIWMRYGTAYRAMYTLFEITFAGNWPTSARPVLEKVSQAYVLFFVPYITLVVFAVIRVISAVFLKDTLDAAQNDAEQLVVDRLRKKAQYVAKLESIFLAIDDSGDGIISEERLNDILQNPKVAAYLETLELDLHEGVALFHLLDNGDGEVTLDEFIDGIMRCKGPARAIDQVAMHADI